MAAVVDSGQDRFDGPNPASPGSGNPRSPGASAGGGAPGLGGILLGLVKSEYRKIFSTHVWWALLIPIAVLTFGAGWFGAHVGTIELLQSRSSEPLPVGLLTVSMSTNFSTIFAALFGTMAITSEHRHKSITTTYLTATPRGAVLSAKLIAYAGIGVLYGVVNMLFASTGSLIGSGMEGFGNLNDWFLVVGAGVLAIVLWTLLGVGFGALVGNAVASIIVLVMYKFVFENTIMLMTAGSDVSVINTYLPGSAGSGIVGNLAVPLFTSAAIGTDTGPYAQVLSQLAHVFVGGNYGYPWWLSLATFAGYTALFVIGGWLVSRQRDIS